MTKDDVFRIMGKYYGNAYYRSAIRLNITQHDLFVETQVLDQINAFGYNFSNTHAFYDVEDKRFVPIILDSFTKYEAVNYSCGLLSAVRFHSYKEFVPRLIDIYTCTANNRIKFTVSDCLYQICAKEYLNLYINIILDDNYGNEYDRIIELLIKLKFPDVFRILIDLFKKYPEQWTWTLLRYASKGKKDEVLPHILPFCESTNSEFKKLAISAKKSFQKSF